jgi:micrococcal nuclease
MNLKKITTLCIAFLIFFSSDLCAQTCSSLIPVVVTQVIDGDTIVVQMPDGKSERVRYLLIDTPEIHHPRRKKEELGELAFRRNRELLVSGEAYLEFDIEKRDRYNRLLAYIWSKNKQGLLLINAELIRNGLALPLVITPNEKYIHTIQKACSEAKKTQVGLWKKASRRLFTPEEIWTFLPFIRGHFILVAATIKDISTTQSRTLFKDGTFSLIIYRNNMDRFRHFSLREGNQILIMGKIHSSYKGSEIILSDPSQIISIKP